jgi:hypothetical protein
MLSSVTAIKPDGKTEDAMLSNFTIVPGEGTGMLHQCATSPGYRALQDDGKVNGGSDKKKKN